MEEGFPRGPLISANSSLVVTIGRGLEGQSGGQFKAHVRDVFLAARTIECTGLFISGAVVETQGLVHSRQTPAPPAFTDCFLKDLLPPSRVDSASHILSTLYTQIDICLGMNRCHKCSPNLSQKRKPHKQARLREIYASWGVFFNHFRVIEAFYPKL